MIRKILAAFSLIILLNVGKIEAQTPAWNNLAAHVGIVEASYMPGTILFTVREAAGPNAAGAWLTYSNGNLDNVKAVYTLLMTAVSTGLPIRIYGTNGTVQFIHIGS